MSSVEPGKKPRSFSQYAQMGDCGWRYKLERLDLDDEGNRLVQRPAAWLMQGTAFHGAMDAWEASGRTLTLDEVLGVYDELYGDEINAACETTPNLSHWFWSGPYNGERDIARRHQIGRDQVVRAVDYYSGRPTPWTTPDGHPAVEVELSERLGSVTVRGFVDRVDLSSSGQSLEPVDYKTGNTPGGPFQLATYGRLLEKRFGEKVFRGYFFMARAGTVTVPYDLREWPMERVVEEYEALDEKIEAGDFKPNPDAKRCRFCSVAQYCEFSAA